MAVRDQSELSLTWDTCALQATRLQEATQDQSPNAANNSTLLLMATARKEWKNLWRRIQTKRIALAGGKEES